MERCDYMTKGQDDEVVVSPRGSNVWVYIDGLAIQIMRDGSDDEPIVCVDVWRRADLGVTGNPVATISVPSAVNDHETT